MSSAFFQKYEPFVNKSAKVLMAETVAPTPDRMFVEIRYKSLYMEIYMVKQIIFPPIKLFFLSEIIICKQRNNKILTWYGRRNDTFSANRPLTGVTITFIRCLYRVTGVSIGQSGYSTESPAPSPTSVINYITVLKQCRISECNCSPFPPRHSHICFLYHHILPK